MSIDSLLITIMRLMMDQICPQKMLISSTLEDVGVTCTHKQRYRQRVPSPELCALRKMRLIGNLFGILTRCGWYIEKHVKPDVWLERRILILKYQALTFFSALTSPVPCSASGVPLVKGYWKKDLMKLLKCVSVWKIAKGILSWYGHVERMNDEKEDWRNRL